MSKFPNTAVVLIDPLNDFGHKDGKLYPVLSAACEKYDTVKHLNDCVAAARKAGIPIFFALHQEWSTSNYAGWRMMTSSHKRAQNIKFVEKGSFGAEVMEGLAPDKSNGDVVVSRHWNSSGFHNTDLDYQLRQRGIDKLVFIGFIAPTCLEATARAAFELAYDITMITDATAGFTIEGQECAVHNWPLFANKVVNTQEWINSLDVARL